LNLFAAAASHKEEWQLQGRLMSADRAGLGVLGFIFGGVTAAVMLVACTVVLGHIEGRYAIDTTPTQVAAIQ
jgi:hypothetical protein